MAYVHRPNPPYDSSFLYSVPYGDCFHFLAHPHLQRSSQQASRFMPLFASSPWTPTKSCHTFVLWVPNGGRVPGTNAPRLHSVSSLRFRESQIPARGLPGGAHTVPLTAPLPKCFLTWEQRQLEHQGTGNFPFTWRGQVKLGTRDSGYFLMSSRNGPTQP